MQREQPASSSEQRGPRRAAASRQAGAASRQQHGVEEDGINLPWCAAGWGSHGGGRGYARAATSSVRELPGRDRACLANARAAQRGPVATSATVTRPRAVEVRAGRAQEPARVVGQSRCSAPTDATAASVGVGAAIIARFESPHCTKDVPLVRYAAALSWHARGPKGSECELSGVYGRAGRDPRRTAT